MDEKREKELIFLLMFIISIVVIFCCVIFLSDTEKDCDKYNTNHSVSYLNEGFPLNYCIIIDEKYGRLNKYTFDKIYSKKKEELKNE